MTSILDVARRAHVSPATVSRVLSDAEHAVSAATRARVLRAADELDFVPNALARGLLKSRLPIAGVIVHDITDPYFAEVTRGVEDAATRGGYLVITCSSDRDPERELSYIRLLRSMRAAAIVFAGSGIVDGELHRNVQRQLTAMRGYGATAVHLSPHAGGEPAVGIDNAAGVSAMVKALVGLGHRRIAFLAGPSNLYVNHRRLAGYRSGLADAGIDFDPALAVESGFDATGGATAIDRLMEVAPDVTAIACSNDLLAIGAHQRLAELGLRIPEDVSLAGFDDIPVASRVAPALSSVRVPLHELGYLGFRHAERALAGHRPRRRTLPTEVVLRDSTAPPPSARRKPPAGTTPDEERMVPA